ncbi:MAG: acetate--CoA ligase family protein [DPANN group archaeon]|nr:acetate--CoA ligase family protein [DPANN group archaeon]
MATLLGAEGYKLLRKYSIQSSDFSEIRDEVGLKNALKKFGNKLVLKVISEEILHKTEFGAVKICENEAQAISDFRQLKRLASKTNGKVLAQRFVEGQQVIIGAKKDATFGHAILFGLGGIFVEIFRDVSFRVCPIDKKEAMHMISETKAFQVLSGARGQKKVNFDVLSDMIAKASRLAVREDVAEMDINPFIINDKAGAAVDVRIIK